MFTNVQSGLSLTILFDWIKPYSPMTLGATVVMASVVIFAVMLMAAVVILSVVGLGAGVVRVTFSYTIVVSFFK